MKMLKTTCILFSVLFVPAQGFTQDLQISYATFLGGTNDDRVHGMSVDSQGSVVITAPVQSLDFPLTSNALQAEPTGVYLTKLSPNGDALKYSTYIGNPGGANYAHGVAIDRDGYIYIAGNTTNPNFPTTNNAFDRSFNGPANQSHGDAFVMKLTPDGTDMVYATFIGGSGMELCGKITVDAEGNVYVIGTTSSEDFPVTPDAFDKTFNGGTRDGRDDLFAIKLDPTGSQLLYSTYIGGSNTEIHGNNMIVDSTGALYFAATTASPDFPVTPDAYDTTYNGGSGRFGAGDGVVLKLSADGSALEYATFIGGEGDDFAWWLSLDKAGNMYVCGSAAATGFPVTGESMSELSNFGYLAKFNPTLSTLEASMQTDPGIRSVAVHETDYIILAGTTNTEHFPVTENALDNSFNGSGDLYIQVFDPVTQKIVYATYFGGSNNDVLSAMQLTGNDLYLAGNTASSDFPASPKAYNETFNGGNNQWGGDAYIAKFVLNISSDF